MKDKCKYIIGPKAMNVQLVRLKNKSSNLMLTESDY